MTSRTDIDTSWAGDFGADDDRPARHSGMDREQHDPDVDPAAAVAGLPPRGGTAGAPPSQASFDDLGIRPEWHASSPPEAVAVAWQSLEEAVEAAVEAERLERALSGEEEQAQREEAARVRSATAAGRTVKAAAPGRDWAAERRHCAAVAAGHRTRARKFRGTYDDLVQHHREAWSARIIEQLPGAKAETLKALAKAGSMVTQLLGDAEAAQTLALEAGGSTVSLPTLPIRQCAASMQALADTIEASDQLAGVDLTRPAMTPSWAERQQIGVALLHGVLDGRTHWLAELERAERYQLSSWTRGVPLGTRPTETTTW